MTKAARKFTPGSSSNASRMIHYIAQLNALNRNGNYLNCTCVPEKVNKLFPGSDSVSYRISNNARISQIIKTSLGGSTQYGNFYLGQPLQLDYLGNAPGMPGGSGTPPKNTF
jgi:hypothetical protein